MRIKRKWVILFLLPSIILFFFVYLFSIGEILVTSFCRWRVGGAISFAGLENYKELFTSGDFFDALKNTLIWVVLQSTVHVAIGVIFALLVTRGKRYSKFFQTIYMLPNVISSAAVAMVFYNLFNPMYGPINKMIQALGFQDFNVNWFGDEKYAFLTVTLTWLPFAALVSILVIAELKAISPSILEAAVVDGASEFQIIWSIKLPMVKNAIGTGTILAASSMLQKFDILTITTNGGPGTRTTNLPLLVYKTAFRDNNFGLANAQGVVLMVVGLLAIGLINKLYRMYE